MRDSNRSDDRGPTPLPLWLRLLLIWMAASTAVGAALGYLAAALLGEHAAGAVIPLAWSVGLVGAGIHMASAKRKSKIKD